MLRHVADDGRTVSLTDQAHGNLEPWRLAPNPHEFLSEANKLALREDILVSVLPSGRGPSPPPPVCADFGHGARGSLVHGGLATVALLLALRISWQYAVRFLTRYQPHLMTRRASWHPGGNASWVIRQGMMTCWVAN